MNSVHDYSRQALTLMDLTALNDEDTPETIIALCRSARTPVGTTAAVCIYPRFVALAKKTLAELGLDGVRVATVTNFPAGSADSDTALAETRAAIASGADEVDVVFPYKALMAGDEQIGLELVRRCRAACGGTVTLKVIIESGELKNAGLIQKASQLAIAGGADFIKTSTGKVPVNATLEAARLMLETIKASGRDVGFKAAGGIRTAAEAQAYLQQAEQIMGRNWINGNHYRFGASSLLNSLLLDLGLATGQAGGDY